MKKIILLFCLLLPVLCLGQRKTCDYSGKEISLENHSLESTFLGKLQGVEKQGYQGMDIYGNYIFSCQNTGIATIYDFNGKRFSVKGQFKLASYHKNNHANVASFGTEFFDPADPMPVIYVSQCQKKTVNGMKDVLYAERVSADLQSSSLVQTILYKDVNHNFGYALQWVVDTQNNFLYGYGNTINNSDPANKHRIVKFRMPSLKDGENGFLTLTDADIIENYLLEDYYNKPFSPIGQGLMVYNDMLFMPTGVGKPETPSILYVWDLKNRCMRNVLDLSGVTSTELEDNALYNGALIIQSQGGLYKIDF